MEEYFPGLYEGLLYIFSELVTWFFVNNFREFWVMDYYPPLWEIALGKGLREVYFQVL